MTSDIDGFLLIDKPAGWTSHDVVAKMRGVLHTRRIGHAGTLDPFATGLLILGVGKATKSLQTLLGSDKTYETTLRLGVTSTTFDPEGVLTPLENVAPPSAEAIEQALAQFRGGYDQHAPLYSAKKINGKKLYNLARADQADESLRPVKHVTIDELCMLGNGFPELSLRVRCGSGTYIRSLGDDIGKALGTGAYVTSLRRTSIASYRVEHALPVTASREELLGGFITL